MLLKIVTTVITKSKSIMKIKALIFAVAILACGTAFAQETNRDENGKIKYGAYETNKFFDNWFVGVGGGVNIPVDGLRSGADVELGKAALAVDAYLGKWIDPCFGIRAGWQGVNSKTDDVENDFSYIHGDFLWNVSNQFWGYKEKRFYNLVPYLTAGLLKTNGNDFAAGAGLLNKFRLGDRVDLTIDLRAIAAEADDYNGESGAIVHGAALGGLAFNLGKTNWTRKSTTVAGYAAAVAAAEAAAAAAKAAKDAADKKANQLADENGKLGAENADLKDQLAKALANQGVPGYEGAQAVYFEIGKATLSATEAAHLETIADVINTGKADTKYVVNGYADKKTGSAKRNMTLSQKRADYVADILVNKYGVCADRISTVANGGVDLNSNPALCRTAIVTAE